MTTTEELALLLEELSLGVTGGAAERGPDRMTVLEHLESLRDQIEQGADLPTYTPR